MIVQVESNVWNILTLISRSGQSKVATHYVERISRKFLLYRYQSTSHALWLERTYAPADFVGEFPTLLDACQAASLTTGVSDEKDR